MKKHTLKLLGGSSDAVRVPADALLEALTALIDGARLATRFLVEGESTRKGGRPAWLDAACAFDVTGLRSGSAIVDFEAPVLGEAVGVERLPQLQLFAKPTTDLEKLSAVECFANVLASVLSGDREQVVADRALLDACARFAKCGSRAFQGVELSGLSRAPLLLREADVPRIELLRDETPGSRAVRVAGVLDTISASKTDVLIKLTGGEQVAARFEEHDLSALKALFGKRVAVSGMGRFRPSGKLLLIDAEHLDEAAPGDEVFDEVPTAQTGIFAGAVALHDRRDIAALYGTWPGDETDEELLAALEAIR